MSQPHERSETTVDSVDVLPDVDSLAVDGSVLVTGASGFIGSRLLRRLRGSGALVHATSRAADPGRDENGVAWHRVDLADSDEVSGLLTTVRPDLIVHLAAKNVGRRDPEIVLPVLQGNLVASVNVMSAALAADTGRVILAGSIEEPGPGEGQETLTSPYAIAKLASREYAQMFHTLWGLPVSVLRISQVYGPGPADPQKLVPYVTRSLLLGESPQLASGRRLADWTYVDDVVEAVLAAARSERAIGKVIPVGTGRAVTVREIVDLIADVIGGEVRPTFDAMSDRPMDGNRVADTGPARELMGWIARTGLREGLEETARWYDKKLDTGRWSRRSRSA